MGVLPTYMLTHPVQPGGEQNKAAYIYSETDVLWGASSAYNCFSAESSVWSLSYHELEMPLCPMSEVLCHLCWEIPSCLYGHSSCVACAGKPLLPLFTWSFLLVMF